MLHSSELVPRAFRRCMGVRQRGKIRRNGSLKASPGHPVRNSTSGTRCCDSDRRTWASMASRCHKRAVQASNPPRVNQRKTPWYDFIHALNTFQIYHNSRCADTYFSSQMNMLMRLKETAHCAGTESYDSDSTSNSHQDDVLDSSLESTL